MKPQKSVGLILTYLKCFQRLGVFFAALLVWSQFVGTAVNADTNIGDIAVIETDATILQPGEPFDLNNKTVTFTPRPGSSIPGANGYIATVGSLAFESTLGTNLSMVDDDFSSQSFGFTFPFFGVNYASVFINSNGHLTFLDSSPDDFHYNNKYCRGDVSSIFDPLICPDAFTVLFSMAEDVPRIAPLWQDWDPSVAGGVFVRSLPDRLVVTWSGVPLFGTGITATFQVVLFNTGVIRMNYQSVATTPGGGYLVGISPGSVNGFLVTTIDFSAGGSSVSQFPSFEPLAQVFGNPDATIPLIHTAALARRFYNTHDDQVDQLVMFTNFTEAMFGAFAFELTTRQTVSGIGDGPPFIDVPSFFGSQGRLHGFVNMNHLGLYPANPNTDFLGTNNTLDLLGQETGHAWLAFVEFNDGGVCSDLLLGRSLVHWSFFHDTDASDMEGNRWQDNGNGTFTSVEATARFSPLDQHIMGLRGSVDVPDFFFIKNPSSAFCPVLDTSTGERSCAPRTGVTVSGTRRNATLSQIQSCEGPRSPSSGFSAVNTTTAWRQAFVLLIRGGTTAPSGDLAKIETIRAAWVPYFNTATDGLGSINTALPPSPAATSEPKLVNISTRGRVLTGDNVMIGGFIIGGSTPKTVLIRGRGPSMGGAPFFVPGTLADPFLQLLSGSNVIAQNDNWQDLQSAEIMATGLDPCQPNPGQLTSPPGCAQESAILITLPPGGYTAIMTGVGGGTGVGLVEVFEIEGASKLINISTRGPVQTGDNVMIGGLIIGGTTPKTVLIRGRGPSMGGAPFFVPGTLANSFLQLFSGSNVVAFNDNWQDIQPEEITATGLDPCQPNPGQSTPPPGCAQESAILVKLPPGGYTAIMSGVGGGTGIGLVEVFEVGDVVIPNILGNYLGSATVTQAGCQNPLNNGNFGFSSTVNVPSQDGSIFSGTGTFTGPATVNLNLTGAVTAGADLMGSFTFTSGLGSGSGTFTGSLVGNTITINFSGKVTSGETCNITGSLSGTR